MHSRWEGVYPYLVTPTEANGSLDAGALRALIDRVIDAGVHGITPLGSSGELVYLPDAMRQQVIETAVAAADGRVPVVAGIGGFSTADIVGQAERASAAGVDGLLIVLLGYTPLSEDDLVSHFRAVSDATDVPLAIYHHPKLTNLPISATTFERLAAIPRVDYVKESSGKLDLFQSSARLAELGMSLFAATSVSPVASMLLGAVGWMSGPASAFPEASVRIFELTQAGRWEDAVRLERAVGSALDVFRSLGPAAATKALLRAAGYSVGVPTPPVSGTFDGIDQVLEATNTAIAGAMAATEPDRTGTSSRDGGSPPGPDRASGQTGIEMS